MNGLGNRFETARPGTRAARAGRAGPTPKSPAPLPPPPRAPADGSPLAPHAGAGITGEKRETRIMFMRINKLQIDLPMADKPDPNAAAAVQELLGGRFGEMSTLMNYMYQSFNFRRKE